MITKNSRANHAQPTPKIPVFNLYRHRETIASGIDLQLAFRFKRRFKACTIKFAGFEAIQGGDL